MKKVLLIILVLFLIFQYAITQVLHKKSDLRGGIRDSTYILTDSIDREEGKVFTFKKKVLDTARVEININKILMDYSANYRMNISMPGNVDDVNLQGITAFGKNESYYDSSRLRFMMLNKDWFVSADNDNKLLFVANLNEMSKALGKYTPITRVNISEMLQHDSVSKTFESISEDTLKITYALHGYEEMDDLVVWYHMKAKNIIRLSFAFSYPMYPGEEYMEESTVEEYSKQKMKIFYECYEIKAPSALGLFDENRILSYNNKKVKMKKFNTYKLVNGI